CLLAVVLQVLQTFLRQNLGGLGMVLGDLIDKIEEGLSPVLLPSHQYILNSCIIKARRGVSFSIFEPDSAIDIIIIMMSCKTLLVAFLVLAALCSLAVAQYGGYGGGGRGFGADAHQINSDGRDSAQAAGQRENQGQ
ncbi:hypothetical protein HPB47_025588, partial [Ixodes persulcatus]